VLEPLVDALPEPFHVVFVLRAAEGLNAVECAECLDIPEETVRTRYFRALSRPGGSATAHPCARGVTR
jgi:RNA polymerase sigma-70 factor (ECF subfamily)